MSRPFDLLILSAPSGAGKSSFIERLCRDYPRLKDVVTYTTRRPRPDEVEGVHYKFISEKEYFKLLKEGFFIETKKVHNNFYGNSWSDLEEIWNHGLMALIDVDVEGARELRRKLGEKNKKVIMVFIKPPRLDVLKERITTRDPRISPEELELRLKNAVEELKAEGDFDFVIYNDRFEEAYESLISLVGLSDLIADNNKVK